MSEALGALTHLGPAGLQQAVNSVTLTAIGNIRNGQLADMAGVDQSKDGQGSTFTAGPSIPSCRTPWPAGVSCSAGSQMRGPSRVVGFPPVGFGARVVSGSRDSTMAISSPGSRSELREGRR